MRHRMMDAGRLDFVQRLRMGLQIGVEVVLEDALHVGGHAGEYSCNNIQFLRLCRLLCLLPQCRDFDAFDFDAVDFYCL